MVEHALREPLRHVLKDLRSFGSECAIVGAIAVSARTDPRFTRDIDLAIAVRDDDEAERLVRFLIGGGYELRTSLEHNKTGRLATARLAHTSSPGVPIDLLLASSGIEQEIVEGAENLLVQGDIEVNVACVGDLIAMKLLSQTEERQTDQQDLVNLLKISTPADRDRAAASISLIEERGYQRGRDLAKELENLKRRVQP